MKAKYFMKTGLNDKIHLFNFETKINITVYCNSCLKGSEFDIIAIILKG